MKTLLLHPSAVCNLTFRDRLRILPVADMSNLTASSEAYFRGVCQSLLPMGVLPGGVSTLVTVDKPFRGASDGARLRRQLFHSYTKTVTGFVSIYGSKNTTNVPRVTKSTPTCPARCHSYFGCLCFPSMVSLDNFAKLLYRSRFLKEPLYVLPLLPSLM